MKSSFSLVGRLVSRLVVAFAWLVAQVIRLSVDVRRRKELCDTVTRPAARAVAYSWTVRITYVSLATFALYRAFASHSIQSLCVGAGMYAAWLLAELLWQFVLYVAATVSRLDSDMERGVTRLVAGRRCEPEVSTVVVGHNPDCPCSPAALQEQALVV